MPSVLKRKKFGEGLRSVVSCAADEPLTKVLVRDGARIVAHRDALGARQRPEDDVDIVLLDELAGARQRDVGLGVGGFADPLDLAAAGRVVGLLEQHLDDAVGVLPAGGERAFERGERAEPDRRVGLDVRGEDGGAGDGGARPEARVVV